MRNIRIGKDIAINWEITINGQVEDLTDKDLTLTMTDPKGNVAETKDFEINDNKISVGFNGTSFRYLGTYTLTLWLNKGKEGQTMVDAVDAFKLVKYTIEEVC